MNYQGTSFYNMSLQRFLDEARHSLGEVILSLESDQILNQMRNDPSLYEFKLAHLQEIIKDQFDFEGKINQIIAENATLKKKIHLLEENATRMSQEYRVEIQDIEIKCKQYIFEKEREKVKLQENHELEIQEAKDHLQRKIKQNYQQEIRSIKDSLQREIDSEINLNNGLKSENKRLRENVDLTHKSLTKNSWDLDEKSRQLENKLKFTEQKMNEQCEEYQNIIQKMQKDMMLIKNSWEKRCMEIEEGLKEENGVMAIRYEEKLKKELDYYVESLKLGKNIIIKDNDEVYQKKIEIIDRHYQMEINKSKEQVDALTKEIDNYKREITRITDQQQTHLQRQKQQQKVFEKEIKQYQLQIQKNQIQLQKIKHSENLLLTELKDVKKNQESEKAEQKKLQNELSLINKKNEQFENEIQSLKKQANRWKQKNQEASKINENLEESVSKQKNKLNQVKEQINQYKIQNEGLNAIIKNLQSSLIKSKDMQHHNSKKQRNKKQKQKKMIAKMDKLSITVKKLQKQLLLLQQNIKYMGQIYKTKLSTFMVNLGDYFQSQKQKIENKYREKVTKLINEMQQISKQERQVIEGLTKQKQNMQLEMRDYEEVIERKDQEFTKKLHKIKQLERDKQILTEQLSKDRNTIFQFQEKHIMHFRVSQEKIIKAEKDVYKALAPFTEKWNQEIKKLLSENQKKDRKLKQLNQKIQEICFQCEEAKKIHEGNQEQIKKYKKKYENLKQQRDQKVENLLKKLETEAKYRINLQKQLKQLRTTVIKNASPTNFNNYSFTDRQYVNNSNVKNNQTNSSKALHQNYERQKQLSQIKEMIAKTKKVIGEEPVNIYPEKDIDRPFSKKTIH